MLFVLLKHLCSVDYISKGIFSSQMVQEVHFHEVQLSHWSWVDSPEVTCLHPQGTWQQVTPIPLCYPFEPKTFLLFFPSVSKGLKWCETCVAGYRDGVFITRNWGCISSPEAWLEDVNLCLRKTFGIVCVRESWGWLGLA